MIWTEEELRQLRQEAADGVPPIEAEAPTAAEPRQRNEADFWRPILQGRDLTTLLWGIAREDLAPEERRIWNPDE